MDPLTPGPIQTGWEFTIERYPSWRFGFIENPDRQFGNGSVWTRTWTVSDGPQPLLTLGNPPVVRVWTGKTVRFSSRPVQKPETELLGGPNPHPYRSTRGFSPGLATSVSSNLRFSFSGFSIYGRSQLCYCSVQNINFGTSFTICVVLAAFIIKSTRHMLPATCWSWVWSIVHLASFVRFEVQHRHIDC
jgi:hypothetical protein